MASQQRYGVHGRAGASRDVERGDGEHELVASFVGAGLGQRLEEGVVELGEAEGVDAGVDGRADPVAAGTGVEEVPDEDRDVFLAEELEARGVVSRRRLVGRFVDRVRVRRLPCVPPAVHDKGVARLDGHALGRGGVFQVPAVHRPVFRHIWFAP